MHAISPEQREAIQEEGTPLPLIDPMTGEVFALLPIEFLSDPESNDCIARVPGITAYGGGQTEEEAVLALMAALDGFIDAFGA